MLAGRMSHYRTHAADLSGLACNVPGCDCAGWVTPQDQQHRYGAPADPYSALWLSTYDVAVKPDGQVLGVGWRPEYILRVRPLHRAEQRGVAGVH
jgi:hypothetical protein